MKTSNKLSTFGAVLFAMIALLGVQNASALPCAASDVSLTINSTIYHPVSCADGVSQGGGPDSETASLDSALGVAGFVYLDKSDDAGTPTGIGGVTFVVGAGAGNSGAWTVSWAEHAGSPNLPLYIDFAVALFGGNIGSGYLFDNVLLTSSPNSGSGTYDINFLNNGGQQPTLSHLLLAGGNATACTENCVSPDGIPILQAVPEPGTLSLLALGLLGAARRRRRSA